jgi:hypothetical protein
VGLPGAVRQAWSESIAVCAWRWVTAAGSPLNSSHHPPCWHSAGTSRFRRIAAAFAALRARPALTCAGCGGLRRITPGFGPGTGRLMRLGLRPSGVQIPEPPLLAGESALLRGPPKFVPVIIVAS